MPLQASVDDILAQFDGGLSPSTNRNVVAWPNGATGPNPVNHVLKEGIIPHVENTLLGKLGTAEGDSTRSALAALDVSINVILTAALGVNTTRAALRDLTTSALPVTLVSPTLFNANLTGIPTAPTAAPLTSTTQVATTAFVTLAVGVETSRATAAESTLTTNLATTNSNLAATNANIIANHAPLVSPALTGTPTAITNVNPSDASTQIATDAFVQSAIGAASIVVMEFTTPGSHTY